MNDIIKQILEKEGLTKGFNHLYQIEFNKPYGNLKLLDINYWDAYELDTDEIRSRIETLIVDKKEIGNLTENRFCMLNIIDNMIDNYYFCIHNKQ